MSSNNFTESTVEQATLDWLAELQYGMLHGPDIAPGEPAAERASFGNLVLLDRLRMALARINPQIPAAALDDALRKVVRADTASDPRRDGVL